MSDSEDSDTVDPRPLQEIHEEIKRCKRNPSTSSMFVSGWDDADEDVQVIQDPKVAASPVNLVLLAAEHDKLKVLKKLIKSQPSLVNAQDADGYTPLHRAAYSNHLRVISYLLSVGCNVHMKTEMGWSPLHSACNWNNYLAAARLLAAGAEPASLSEGEQTPLHLVSSISHCKSTLLILLLREDSVDIAREKNRSNQTPEELARGHGIYAPLFEMASPASSYIKSRSFTCNPYVRAQLLQEVNND